LFPNSGIFLLGKSFFANSSGLDCWESVGLLAKPQFPVVSQLTHTTPPDAVAARMGPDVGLLLPLPLLSSTFSTSSMVIPLGGNVYPIGCVYATSKCQFLKHSIRFQHLIVMVERPYRCFLFLV
jgi:hypothetical protein